MRKMSFMFVFVLTFTFILASSSVYAKDEVATFPDENLEKVIREKIDKPTGDVLKKELKI